MYLPFFFFKKTPKYWLHFTQVCSIVCCKSVFIIQHIQVHKAQSAMDVCQILNCISSFTLIELFSFAQKLRIKRRGEQVKYRSTMSSWQSVKRFVPTYDLTISLTCYYISWQFNLSTYYSFYMSDSLHCDNLVHCISTNI